MADNGSLISQKCRECSDDVTIKKAGRNLRKSVPSGHTQFQNFLDFVELHVKGTEKIKRKHVPWNNTTT